jgi:hypothetical protein
MGFWDWAKSDDIGQTLEKKATLLRKNGDPNGALIALMEQEEFYRNQCSGDFLSLISSLGHSALTSQLREDLIVATDIANSASDGKLSQRNEIIERIARSLSTQAAILVELSRRGEAYGRMDEALSLAVGIGNKDLTTEIEDMRERLGLKSDPRFFRQK